MQQATAITVDDRQRGLYMVEEFKKTAPSIELETANMLIFNKNAGGLALIEMGKVCVNEAWEDADNQEEFSTPLCAAVFVGWLEGVKWLLAAGADPWLEVESQNGTECAFWMALEQPRDDPDSVSGWVELLQLLYSASPRVLDYGGRLWQDETWPNVAVAEAERKGYKELARALRKMFNECDVVTFKINRNAALGMDIIPLHKFACSA